MSSFLKYVFISCMYNPHVGVHMWLQVTTEAETLHPLDLELQDVESHLT